MILFDCIAIMLACKLLALISPIKKKPWYCDKCLTFWISLLYFYTNTEFQYFIIIIYSLANSYGCVLFEEIKYRLLR